MRTACGSINGAVGQFELAPSVVLLDRLEVVVKSPVREAYPEVAGGDISETEMDTQPHSCVDNVRAQSPSAVVVPMSPAPYCELFLPTRSPSTISISARIIALSWSCCPRRPGSPMASSGSTSGTR